MTITAVTSLGQFNEIISQESVTIFDFWATWCGPCVMISPIFQELSGKFPSIKFYKVDVDENNDISQIAGVRAMPTFIVYKGGKKLKDLVGASPQALQALVASVSN